LKKFCKPNSGTKKKSIINVTFILSQNKFEKTPENHHKTTTANTDERSTAVTTCRKNSEHPNFALYSRQQWCSKGKSQNP